MKTQGSGVRMGCLWRPVSLRGVAVLIILTLVLDGCKRNQFASATTSDASTAFANLPGIRKTPGLRVLGRPGNKLEVEYSSRTSIVDMATVARTLKGATADHRIFLFEDSPQLRAKLVPGNFVLFEGLDLRKVEAYAVDPNTKYLVVGTDKAPITEALKKADVQINTPIDFDQLFAQMSATNAAPTRRSDFMSRVSGVWDWIQPTAYAGISNTEVEGEVKFSDSNFAEWTCHYHFTRSPGPTMTGRGMNFEFRLTRDAAGLDASITMKGSLSKFELISSILMENGSIQHAYYKNVGLHGDGTFDWEIHTSQTKTPMNEVRFKLPFKVGFPLIEFTGLPMSIELGAAVLFHPAFTTKGQVAHGTFNISFSGDQGFQLTKNSMETDGATDAKSAIDKTVAFSPLAAFGLVVAGAFPRVELVFGMDEMFEVLHVPIPASMAESLGDLLMNSSLAGSFLKKIGNPLKADAAAYFQVVWSTTAAHSGMQSIVPCQQFTFVSKGQIGYDVDLMGIEATNVKDVFSKEWTKRDPDAKICGGGNNS